MEYSTDDPVAVLYNGVQIPGIIRHKVNESLYDILLYVNGIWVNKLVNVMAISSRKKFVDKEIFNERWQRVKTMNE